MHSVELLVDLSFIFPAKGSMQTIRNSVQPGPWKIDTLSRD